MLAIEPNAAAADVWHVDMGVQPEYVVAPEYTQPTTGVSGPETMFGLAEDGVPGAFMWIVGTALTVGVIALGVFLGMRAARARSS